MPHYIIKPTDRALKPYEIVAPDAGEALNIVQRMQYGEAEVFEKDTYLFSLRLSENGIWSIYQRPSEPEPEIMSFG